MSVNFIIVDRSLRNASNVVVVVVDTHSRAADASTQIILFPYATAASTQSLKGAPLHQQTPNHGFGQYQGDSGPPAHLSG